MLSWSVWRLGVLVDGKLGFRFNMVLLNGAVGHVWSILLLLIVTAWSRHEVNLLIDVAAYWYIPCTLVTCYECYDLLLNWIVADVVLLEVRVGDPCLVPRRFCVVGYCFGTCLCRYAAWLLRFIAATGLKITGSFHLVDVVHSYSHCWL